MTIQPIQTRYAGHHFRSRLEARWAVFMDHLDVPWEYEPQGYLVGPSQRPYLPDFWLPSENAFFEVKGTAPDDDYRKLLQAFTIEASSSLFLAVGSIPNPDTYQVAGEESASGGLWMDAYFDAAWEGPDGKEERGGWDNYQTWCACASGKHFGIQFMGYGERVKCGCGRPDVRVHSDRDPQILAAYQAARSARFEHGQCGA